MNSKQYLQNFIMITGLVVILYIAAVNIGLFYIFWWYDSMMHVIGGMAIGYLALAVGRKNAAHTSHKATQGKHFSDLGFATILAFSIGVLWEIFERIGNHFLPTLLAYGGIGDTMLDIVCAIIGALAVVVTNQYISSKS